MIRVSHSLACVLMLATASLPVGCGKKKDTKGRSSALPDESPTPEPDTVGTIVTMDTLDAKPEAAFDIADAIVGSAGTRMGGAVGAGTVVLGLTADDGDIGCHADNSEPVDLKDSSKNNAQGFFTDSDPRYATAKLYCAVAGTANNATTIKGSYHMPRVFACALADIKDLAFDGVEHDVELTATRACFGDLLDDPDTGLSEGGKIPVKVTLTSPALNPGWDYALEVKAESKGEGDPGAHYRMNFKNVPGEFHAFSIYSKGEQPVGDDGVSLAVDLVKGEVRYSYRRDITDCDGIAGPALATCFVEAPSQDAWRAATHLALLVKGTIGADDTFSTVSHLSGAHSKVYADDDEGTLKYNGALFTVTGSPAGGMSQRAYKTAASIILINFLGAAAHVESSAAKLCFKEGQDPAAGLCAGNEGISLDLDAKTVFYVHPGDLRHPRNYEWQAKEPLDFEQVALDDLSL